MSRSLLHVESTHPVLRSQVTTSWKSMSGETKASKPKCGSFGLERNTDTAGCSPGASRCWDLMSCRSVGSTMRTNQLEDQGASRILWCWIWMQETVWPYIYEIIILKSKTERLLESFSSCVISDQIYERIDLS